MQNSVQQKMFTRIQGWQQFGLKQTAWYEKHNMAYATFHYWYKRYRDQAPITPKKSSDNFIKLRVDNPVPAGSWCELSFANGKKLVFQQPVNAEYLRSLID